MRKNVFCRWLQFLSITACAILLFGISDLAVAASSPTITIQLTGEDPQVYEVALDEVYSRADGWQKILPQTSKEGVEELVRNLVMASGKTLFLVLYPQGGQHNVDSRRVLTDEILVQASPQGAAQVSASPGVHRVEALSFGSNLYKVTVADPTLTVDVSEKLKTLGGVSSSEPQVAARLVAYATPDDPLFSDQWHLRNFLSRPNNILDLNVTSVWDTYKGDNQTICIVDSGVDLNHEDLFGSIQRTLCYDFIDRDADPSPILAQEGSFHGTACAGVAAGIGFNSKGIAGVAPKASLAVIRLIPDPVSDITIAEAMAFNNNAIKIKSNSWGPAGSMVKPGTATAAAMKEAATTGRNGRGTVFVFSSGNDAPSDANFNGYANAIYTIAVGAVDARGVKTRLFTGGIQSGGGRSIG